MTTEAQEEQHGPTALNWRLDALHAKVDQLKEEVILPVKETAHAAMQGLKAAMASLADRSGPDPDFNASDEDLRTLMKAFVDLSRHSRGSGSINGSSKILTVLVAINTALLVGIGGWLLVTVQRHDTEIAVIQYQLSQQVPRGRP